MPEGIHSREGWTVITVTGKAFGRYYLHNHNPRDRRPEPKRNDPDSLPVDNLQGKVRDLWQK
jgi:hypothetical protein